MFPKQPPTIHLPYRTFVGFIERGERNITLETMSKLARGLKVGLETLVRGL